MVKRLVEACVDAGTCAVDASHYAALLSALASLWTQVKHQLVATMNNDLIGGSIAFAVTIGSGSSGSALALFLVLHGALHLETLLPNDFVGCL